MKAPAKALRPRRANRTAADALAARITARPNTELRRITVPDARAKCRHQADDRPADALAEEPRRALPAFWRVSDGRVHDARSAA